MEELFFMGYEAATALVPFFIALAVSARSCRRHGIALSTRYYLLTIAFAIYIVGIFYATGAGTIYDLLRYGFSNTVNVNLVPFSHEIYSIGYALNIILFVPLGILVPLIWKRLDNWKSVLASGLGLVAIVEISQLCNSRVTDIDDIIMNMAGTVLGYLIYLATGALFGRDEASGTLGKPPRHSHIALPSSRNGAPSYQLSLFIGVMFLGRFFLFNDMGFASLLYSF